MGTIDRKKTKALVLAAGYATRLYPLTLNIPKSLLRVAKDKAVIDFIVDELQDDACVEEVIIVTNHRFAPDFRRWAARRRKKNKRRLAVLDDGTRSNDDRLGAIGDIYFAVKKKKISGDFIVFGGDNLFDKGFRQFLEFAGRHKPFVSLGLFDIKNKKDASRFGVVRLDAQKKVISFEEKPQRPRSTLVATCLYYFPAQTKRLLEAYIKDKGTPKDAPGHYIRWLLKKSKVYGLALKKGHWYDIGHFDSYREVVNRYNT